MKDVWDVGYDQEFSLDMWSPVGGWTYKDDLGRGVGRLDLLARHVEMAFQAMERDELRKGAWRRGKEQGRTLSMVTYRSGRRENQGKKLRGDLEHRRTTRQGCSRCQRSTPRGRPG